MGVTVATTRVAASTSGGTQNITTSDCGGLTPVAAMFVITNATADATHAATAIIGIGFATSSSERLVVCTGMDDNQATTDCYRRMTEDECIMLIDPNETEAGSIICEADFSQFITNGCQISWGVTPPSAFLITVTFFCGSDVSAHVDTATSPSTQDDSTDVTDPGFEPDVVLCASTRSAFNDTASTNAAFSWGCAVNTAGDENYSVNLSSQHGADFATPVENSRSDRCLYNIYLSNRYSALEITGFDSNGFSLYCRDSTGAQTIGYLALNFNSAASVWLGDITSPTSTGDDAYTGPGFTPQALILGMGRDGDFSADPSIDANSAAGITTFGVGVVTENAEYSMVICDEDGADTSNTSSFTDDIAIHSPDIDQGTTTDLQATGPSGSGSFDANGFTLNYTQVDSGSGRTIWALAIEETAAESASVSPSASESPSVSPSASESPSVSPSASVSPSSSASPSPSPGAVGDTTWGHDTGVTETNIRDFAGNWTGTGVISGSGDAEIVTLDPSEYMESEIIQLGDTVQILQNSYDVSGEDAVLKYRHGATPNACAEAAWSTYSVPFESDGYVQVRIENT